MAFFEELSVMLHNAIGQKILNNQNICKTLYYYPECTTDGDYNFNYDPLSQPDISDTRILLMDKIFPLPKMPDAETEQKGILTVTLNGGSMLTSNTGYRNINIVFDIVFHLKAWIVKNNYRPFIIAEEIDKMFNYQLIDLPITNKPEYIGFACKDYNNYFYGLQIIYQVTVNSNIECNPSPQNININRIKNILNNQKESIL